MSVYNRISDRTRPWETVWDHTIPYKTMRNRVWPYGAVYTTAHEVHSTSELNRVNIVYKSYGIELELGGTVNVQLIE